MGASVAALLKAWDETGTPSQWEELTRMCAVAQQATLLHLGARLSLPDATGPIHMANAKEVTAVTARIRRCKKTYDLVAHLGSFDVGALGLRRVRHQIWLQVRSFIKRPTHWGYLPPVECL